MRKLVYTLCLLPFAALATPPDWANNDKDKIVPPGNDPTVVTTTSNALAASAAVATAEQMQRQSQAQLQGQQQVALGGAGGNALSEGSTASATSGDSSATVGDVSANVGAVTATLGSVVESGAVQSSTNVVSNYREAAQAVSLVLTTACGTAAGASGREWTFSTAQGQDAFCKNLALANLYLSLGQQEKALTFIAAAEQLADIDTFFDNFTTIITLGILK